MVKENKIKLDFETRGLEEAIEQVEDLREAFSTAPRVVIKNPRDCTITAYGSEYNPPQQVAQPEPEGIEGKKDKLRVILYHLQEACLHTLSCKECPIEKICEEGDCDFYPSRWSFGK